MRERMEKGAFEFVRVAGDQGAARECLREFQAEKVSTHRAG